MYNQLVKVGHKICGNIKTIIFAHLATLSPVVRALLFFSVLCQPQVGKFQEKRHI